MSKLKDAAQLLKDNGYEVLTPVQVEAKERAKEVLQLFFKFSGNMSAVARESGVSRQRVQQVLDKYFGLKGTGYRDETELIKHLKEELESNGNDITIAAEKLKLTAWKVATLRKEYLPELHPSKTKSSKISDADLKASYMKHEGNVRKVAEELQCDPGGLYDRLIKFGLRGRGNRKASDEQILVALKETKGNKQKAARFLGISPATISNRVLKMKEDGLIAHDYEKTLKNS